MSGQRADLLRHERTHVVAGLITADGQEHHVAGLTLHQRGDRRLASCPQNQVAFPVSRHGAVCDIRGSVRNQDHVFDVAARILAAMRPATSAPRTQTRGEFLAQCPLVWTNSDR